MKYFTPIFNWDFAYEPRPRSTRGPVRQYRSARVIAMFRWKTGLGQTGHYHVIHYEFPLHALMETAFPGINFPLSHWIEYSVYVNVINVEWRRRRMETED